MYSRAHRALGYFAATIALAATLIAVDETKSDQPFQTITSGRPVRKNESITRSRLVLANGVSAPRPVDIAESYGKLPLSFEANQGQSDRQVKFLARGSGYTLFLTSNEAVLALKKELQQGNGDRGTPDSPRVTEKTNAADAPEYLRMQLVGANPSSPVSGADKLPGKSNYFIGNNPNKWRTNIPHYAKVQYAQVYPGVDLVYYGDEGRLEYDFVVAPGANPSAIRLGFGSQRKLRVDQQGALVVATKEGEIRFEPPQLYQEAAGKRERVDGGYSLLADNTLGFDVKIYDRTKPLVIDPVLVYSTYFGADSGDAGRSIAVDSAGNVYITGRTDSPNFPTVAPIQAIFGGGPSGTNSVFDAFVTKINAAGTSVVYSTYLGGSDYDFGTHIAVDPAGNAYVAGVTRSTNFPTMNALQPKYGGGANDAFVAKINASGSALVYSTYLGGSGDENPRGAGVPIGVAVDSTGNAYVVGETTSSDFPTVNALQPSLHGFADIFVAKINATGSALVYSTYLGGSNEGRGTAIAVDLAGNAYITGATNSTDFPTVNALQPTYGGGAYDAFVTKINATGSALVYSTYLGGSGDENLGTADIALDSAGSAYVIGVTSSNNFPTVNALQATLHGTANAFITKINSSGTALVYSTYLGGSGIDLGSGIAVDGSGAAYVIGDTNSKDFPTVAPFQAGFSSNSAFISKISGNGATLVYSGSFGDGGGAHGFDIAVDSSGSAYVTGTDATIPLVNALQTNPAAGVFIAKISPSSVSPAVSLSSGAVTFPGQLITT